MTDKEALDRLNSINLSLEQKLAILDVIKNLTANFDDNTEDIPIVGTINKDIKENSFEGEYTHYCTITPIKNFIPEIGKLYKVKGIKQGNIIFYFSNSDIDEGITNLDSNIIFLNEGQGIIFNMDSRDYMCYIHCTVNKQKIITNFSANLKFI